MRADRARLSAHGATRLVEVLDLLDLDHGVRALTVPTAVVVGTADRLTPVVHARALVATLPNCVGVTELTGVGT